MYWVKDHHRRNLDVEPEMWTEEELIETIQRKEAEYKFEKVDVDLINPVGAKRMLAGMPGR